MAGSEGRRGVAARQDRVVALWVLIGAVSATVAISGGVRPALPWPTVLALAASLAVLGTVGVQVMLRGANESTNLSELALVPIMVLLEPGLAVLVAAAGGVVAEAVLTRGQVRKLVFNLAFLVTGVALGSWVHGVVAGPGFSPDLAGLSGAALAGAAYVLVNLLALSGVVAAGAGRPWSRVLLEEAPSSLVLNLGTALYGVLAAALVVLAPWTLVFLLLPILLHHGRMQARSHGHEQLAAERDRFERTVDGTSDGVVLLDPDDRIEVFNPTVARLAGIDAPAAIGATLDRLGLDHLDPGAPTADDDEHRVTLGHRTVGVRRSDVTTAGRRRGHILAIRDITQEAELAAIREDLVSRVSHEMRTPLTMVVGFLETLRARDDDLEPDRRRELVEVAHRSSLRLSVQVSNLMVWSRIESRTGLDVPAPTEGTSVSDVIAAVLDEELAPEPTAVHLDRGLRVPLTADDLHTVLANLLTNAGLYGAPPVEVHATALGDRVELAVTDRGPGLPGGTVERVFEPFAQASVGLRRTAHGLGLGLAIVRALAASAGGDVRYEIPDGGGARFVVGLPAVTVPG